MSAVDQVFSELDQTVATNARAFLRVHADMNDGAGLIISPAMAKRLAAMGVDGPFTISRPIPVERDE